jgi:ABC-type molybdate transport system substrate-binding protein
MLPSIFPRAGIEFDRIKQDKTIQINRKGGYVANLVKMKTADAAMVWNAVAALRLDALDVVEIPARHLPVPGVDTISSATGKDYKLTPVRVTVASLKCSNRPEDAEKFAEFLASDEASAVFKKFGFASTTPVVEYVKGQPTEHAKKMLPTDIKEKINAK